MRIRAIRHAVISLDSPGRSAATDFAGLASSAVAIIAHAGGQSRPIVGLGFGSIGRSEVDGLLARRFVPRLLAADPGTLLDEKEVIDPVRAWEVMMAGEKPGGHGERAVAVGALDMALWDLAAKASDRPLYQVLSERFGAGPPDRGVRVYAAGGYYRPGEGLAELQRELRAYLELGFTSIKIKVAGARLETDLRRIEAALGVVGDGDRLAVDANGRLEPDEAERYADALTAYRLRWFEEPVDPLDFAAVSALAERYPHPLATGENLFSMADVRNLVRYAGLRRDRDLLQLDPALSYGVVEYHRVLQMLSEHGWSPERCIPHGGHQLLLHAGAGLGLGGAEAYPRVFRPLGGFSDDVVLQDGVARVPDHPGIGLEHHAALMTAFRDALELDDLPQPAAAARPRPMRTIAPAQLRQLVSTIYLALGVPPAEAATVARHQVEANLCGHDSHGVIWVPRYVEQIERGQLIPGAPMSIGAETATTAVVDGNWNFGFVVTERAMDVAIDKARQQGVAALVVRRQGHIGRLGAYTARAAENGMIGLLTADSGAGPKSAVPFGGTVKRLGTNPVSLAAPSDRGPVLLDIATTVVASGKVEAARQRGGPLPVGWIVDREGRPTTDPEALSAGGALLPLGGDQGHKGYGLGFIIEVLSGLLTGIGFGEDPQGFHNDGVFMAVFDVGRFRELNDFRHEVDAFIDYVKSAPPAEGFSEVLYPGELEQRTKAERSVSGIPLDEHVLDSVLSITKRLGVGPTIT